MDKESINQAIEAKLIQALTNVAHLINAESVRFTPVYTGRLRRERQIRLSGSDKSVYLVQSPQGSDSAKYAKYQYFNSLRHAGSLSKLEPVPALDGKRKKGKGDKYIYNYRYRRALSLGMMSKMEAPRWFERALTDTKVMDRMRRVIKNSFG